MDENDTVSAETSEENLLQEQVDQSEVVLRQLEYDLRGVNGELEALTERNHHFDVLQKVCNSLEELEELDAAHLFWDQRLGNKQVEHLQHARSQMEAFADKAARIEDSRQAIVAKIGDQNAQLDYLHYDLRDAIEREESRKNQWVVEREPGEQSFRAQVMPWARGGEEDQRMHRSLEVSLAACLMLALLISIIDIPILERSELIAVPERIAKLVREQLPPPPPIEAIAEPEIPDEDIPEPEPELVQELPDELPENVEEVIVAEVIEPDTREQVKTKGILAFRDSFASRANIEPTAQLGSQASLRNAGEEAVGRPTRAMVTTNAPGSSGGINLANISRDVGGGGQAIAGVQVTRVASSIGGAEGSNRPLSGGAFAGRTDEEIQIVFDRYKAALYRLYNRELRKDPTLRGQLILRLTIEPDGSVSFCQVQSSDMGAPSLAEQVVARVNSFDFGAKEDIVAMTIIYPIDFLPAA